MCWVIIGETFPVRTRAKQAALATAFNWLGNFLISFLSPIADDGIGYAYGYVFVGCNLAGALIIWFFYYESRSLSLENLDRMYGEPHVKPWTSTKWVPPGYISRERRDPDAGDDDVAAASGRAEREKMTRQRKESEEPITSHDNGNGSASSASPSEVEAGRPH